MGRASPTLAKLSRPRLYGALPRERLFALIDQYRRHPVIWVAGHPGAGKTTLVASYLESRRLGGLWFQVDAGDADPATFFYYLKAGADACRRGSGLSLLTPEYLADVPGFARRFFRQLFGGFEPGDMLVFDNAQALPDDSPTAALMAAACEEIPHGVNVAVISRVDPPAVWARPVAHRSVAVVEWQDLRFTESEARALAVSRPGVTGEAVRQLVDRCDGWAAGVTLLLERAGRSADVACGASNASLQVIFDYFAGLLLDQAPANVRRTVPLLAFLPVLSEELAVQLSGDPDAGSLLRDLYRRHLFVHRRDDIEGTYTFHALFREFLLQRAAAAMSSDAVRQTRLSAARLLRERGYREEALDQFVEAQDWVSAATLLEESAEQLIRQGRGSAFRGWLSRIPARQGDAPAWLAYWHGESWLAVDNGRARECLTHAGERFRASGDRLGEVCVAITMIETCWITQTGFEQSGPWRDLLASTLAADDGRLGVPRQARALAALTVAELNPFRGGALIVELSRRLEQFLVAEIDDDQRVRIGVLLMVLQVLSPSLDEARRLMATVDPIAAKPSTRAIYRVMWLGRSGMLAGVLGDYDDGLQRMDEGERVVHEHALDYRQLQFRLFRVWLELSRGNEQEAGRQFDVMQREGDPARPADRYLMGIAGFDVAAHTGKVADARRHASSALQAAHEVGIGPAGVALALQYTAIALADCGDFDEVEPLLTEADALMADPFARRYAAEFRLIAAYVRLKAGRRDDAAPILREALDLARESDNAYYSRMVPHFYQTLFAEALCRGIDREYVIAVIRRFSIPAPSTLAADWPWPIKVLTLGRFAIESEGQPLIFGRKTPRKLLALLKVLIAFGGRGVPISRVTDALWPDADADMAEQSFRAAVKRLREMLGRPDVLVVTERQVSLDVRSVWVDAFALEQGASRLGSMSDAQIDAALGLYQGEFLPQEVDAHWASAVRERMRASFVRLVEARAGKYERDGALDKALEQFRSAIDADDLAEVLYQGEIRFLLALGRPAEARATLYRLERSLATKLGTRPSAGTRALLEIDKV